VHDRCQCLRKDDVEVELRKEKVRAISSRILCGECRYEGGGRGALSRADASASRKERSEHLETNQS